MQNCIHTLMGIKVWKVVVCLRVCGCTVVRHQSCHCRKALRGTCSSEYKLSPVSSDRI